MLNEKSIEIYSSRDKIREQLIELAKDYMQLENFDFNKSSYLSYILNMLSFLDSNLLYYVSSVYREQFLSKASIIIFGCRCCFDKVTMTLFILLLSIVF